MTNDPVHHASIINKDARASFGASPSNHEAGPQSISGKPDAAPAAISTSESLEEKANSEDLMALAHRTALFIHKLAETCTKTSAASEAVRDLLLHRLDAAQMESLDARKRLEVLQGKHDVLQTECAEHIKVATLLKIQLDAEIAQRDQLQKSEADLRTENEQLKIEVEKSVRGIIPEQLVELFPTLEIELTDEGASEVRYQLHTLKFLSKAADATASRVADAIGRLSTTLCAELKSNPLLLQGIRGALNNALWGDISVMEIEPGIPIDEVFMTGRGLQGCRTVSAIQSWAVIKGGVVIRKAEIVPAS